MEGRALWSAVKQRKESEQNVNTMKNRIKKLELDQNKLNRNLILMSSIINSTVNILGMGKYSVHYYLI